jgi:hypothetical protein
MNYFNIDQMIYWQNFNVSDFLNETVDNTWSIINEYFIIESLLIFIDRLTARKMVAKYFFSMNILLVFLSLSNLVDWITDELDILDGKLVDNMFLLGNLLLIYKPMKV